MNIWISPPDMRARNIPCPACYLSSTSHRINASAMPCHAMPERRRLLCTQTKPQILMTLMPFPEASGEKQSCPRRGTYHRYYIQQRMKELRPPTLNANVPRESSSPASRWVMMRPAARRAIALNNPGVRGEQRIPLPFPSYPWRHSIRTSVGSLPPWSKISIRVLPRVHH